MHSGAIVIQLTYIIIVVEQTVHLYYLEFLNILQLNYNTYTLFQWQPCKCVRSKFRLHVAEFSLLCLQGETNRKILDWGSSGKTWSQVSYCCNPLCSWTFIVCVLQNGERYRHITVDYPQWAEIWWGTCTAFQACEYKKVVCVCLVRNRN